MASFEQNQQDQFNMNNSLDQVKQFQAELDKATTSIGAAELEAEEELLGVRLKNLSKTQQTKLVQLGQLLELEEKGIQELAKLKLTLSNRQFAVRKKEIQKEFQLYKAEAENFFKSISKYKVTTPAEAPKKASTTSDIKASTKSKAADAAIQKADKKVKIAEYAVGQVSQEITDAISAIQEIAQAATKAVQAKSKPPVEQKPGTPTDQDTNQQGAQPVTPKVTETNFSNGGLDSGDKVDVGMSPEDIREGFEGILTYLDNSRKLTKEQSEDPSLLALARLNKTITKDLNSITAKDKDGNYTTDSSQTTLSLASSLIDEISAANEAETKLKEFTANEELNRRLTFAKEEHSLREKLAKEELDGITKNEKKKAAIAFTAANRDKLLAKQKQDRENKYLDEYAALLLEAGDYAISLEEYKADQERKRHKAAKKEAVGGMVDGLKKFGTGEFSMADVKKSYGEYMGQRTAELQESGLDESSAKLTAQFELLAEAAGGLQAVLDANVRKIADVQGFVDTRLQGSQVNDQKGNSYWKQLLKDAKGIAGASPFIKQETFVENIKTLVDKGISFDIKQRAFLMTIQEKIANTFDVADGTLLRLIRIQQQDTTAGRLGMESALNTFLNQMYETSEYLESVAKSVRTSLEEMQALMDGAGAAEVEFQVQKWMGSLYSVGMSDSAVQGIAQTLGQIASGDVSGLTGSGTGNLLIMAANEAGKSVADILQKGLDADETNELMQAMVNYLAEIAETSSDSKVVQQQLANVYGLKASDLKAATNLATSLKDVSKQNLAYDGMLGQLESMMNTIRHRTSISEGMTNMWDNVMYSMASTQASNPILYALPKMANLLRDVTGGSGIDLPFINVMGFGVDLNTSVADLMSIASMAGTALGALGPLFTGVADLVNPLVGRSMLSRAGIKTSGKAPVLARGSAQPLQNLAGSSISESGYIGNSSGEDVKNATLQDAEDDKKKQLIKAEEDEDADDIVIKAQQSAVNIFALLEEMAHGSQSLRVKVINSETSGVGVGNNMHTDNGNWVLTF